jgi:hypothetical protein
VRVGRRGGQQGHQGLFIVVWRLPPPVHLVGHAH